MCKISTFCSQITNYHEVPKVVKSLLLALHVSSPTLFICTIRLTKSLYSQGHLHYICTIQLHLYRKYITLHCLYEIDIHQFIFVVISQFFNPHDRQNHHGNSGINMAKVGKRLWVVKKVNINCRSVGGCKLWSR